MTLDTHIFIYDPVDQQEVFEKVCEFLDIPDTKKFKVSTGEPYGCVPSTEISNHPGQGFNAWVMTYANPDGIRYSEEYKASEKKWHDEWHLNEDEYPDGCDCTEDFADLEHRAGPHYMQISMDTAYGCRTDRGESCTELHARVIVELGQWLEERGVSFAWENEYSGTIHQGIDEEGLVKFLGGGDDAMDWFNNTVMPALPRLIEKTRKESDTE